LCVVSISLKLLRQLAEVQTPYIACPYAYAQVDLTPENCVAVAIPQQTTATNADFQQNFHPLSFHLHVVFFPITLGDITQQLCLQNILPLLVLFTGLKCLIILPAHRFLTLSARYVSHYVSSRRHVAFRGIPLVHIHHGVEEVGFTMLAAEILLRVSKAGRAMRYQRKEGEMRGKGRE
jgi:hypothetical protein